MSLTHQTPVPAAGAIVGRRRFLNSAAALGAATVGLVACNENRNGAPASAVMMPAVTSGRSP